MSYKISELVAKTNVPKSTILYYIKEGLLPKANQIKANVHKYNDEHIEIIKYIQYMKHDMGSNNEQIKIALKQKNNSFSSSYTMLAPLINTLSCINTNMQHYTKDKFLEHFEIDENLLNTLLNDNILMPLSIDDYTQKEASIIHLIDDFLEVGVDYQIIKEYVSHAQALSKLELEMQQQLCKKRDDDNFSTLWKIMFETLFNTKQYIFNRSTYRVLYQALKDEIIGIKKTNL